jgi:hypothetical protein
MAALRSRLRGAIVWSANPLEINVETKLISGGCRNDDADGVKAGLPVQRGVNFAESSSGLWPTKTSPAPHPLRARASPRSWREVLYCWCWRLLRTVVGRISGHNPNFRLSNADCYRVGIPQTRQTHASPRLTIWSTGPSASVAVTGQREAIAASKWGAGHQPPERCHSKKTTDLIKGFNVVEIEDPRARPVGGVPYSYGVSLSV